MNKLYNTQEDIASGFSKFLHTVDPNIRKTQLNILPYILFGILSSESLISLDKELRDYLQINILILIYFTIKSFVMLFFPIRKNMMIKGYILFLITCILIIIIQFL